mgnify:CR=1 FL=1
MAPAATLYHVGHKGTIVTGTVPITADAVRALGLPLEELNLCENGQSEWKGAEILPPVAAVAAPVSAPAAAPAGAPPWIK